MTTKQRRVRARVIGLGPTFRRAADKLRKGASQEALAVASTMVDHTHQQPNRIIKMKTVMKLVDLSDRHICRLADDHDHDFPPSFSRVPGGHRTWHLWDILDWVRERTRLPY